MKKLILVFAAIAITSGVYAQTDSTSRKMSPPDINNTNDEMNQNRDVNNNQIKNDQNNPNGKIHPNGVIMQNGKMMTVKDGQMRSLDHDMTMINGTRIMSDGTYIKKDGTKMMMEEGQHVDMSGHTITPKTNEDKNMYLVPDSTRKNIEMK